MRALVVSLSVLLTAGSCQFINSMRRGDNPVNAGKALARDGAQAARDTENANRECQASAERTVAWEEELSIGGAVALGMAAKTKGVFIEPSTELPAGKPDPAQWKDKKPAAPAGAKTDLHAYVNKLGKSLAINSARPYIDWKFVVIDDPAVNAFSAPGGYVMVTTGLLKTVENEAQLAGVLAHEIGHVVHRHAITVYQKTKKEVCVNAKLAGKGAAAASRALGGASLNHFLRVLGAPRFDPEQLTADLVAALVEPIVDEINNVGLGGDREKEADKTAAELLIFSGYDPKEFKKLIGKLPDSGGYRAHPSNADRQKVIDEALAEHGAFLHGLKAPATDGVVAAAVK